MKLNKTSLILPLFLTLIATKINAQNVPPTDNPSRIDEQIEIPTPPPSQIDIPIPTSTDLIPPQGAENERFILQSLELEGVTAYQNQDLENLYQDSINQEISLTKIYDIANKINQKYRDDGYILTQVIIPQQTISNGEVKIQVIEGYIDTVEFEGLSEAQQARLEGFGEKIKASKPLNNADLERYLLLANDLAGFTVRGVLGEGDAMGAGKLVFVASHDPVDGYINFNNRGTDSVGDLRLQSAVLLNSLMNQGERLTISGSIAPNNLSELNSGSLALNFPIGYEGLQVSLSGGVTAIRPGDDLKQFDINGNTTTFSTSVSYPLIRSRDTNLSLRGTFDYLDEEVTTNFLGTETYLSEDKIRVLRLGTNADMRDNTGITYGNMELSFGLDAFGAKSEATATRPLSRPNGNASFTKLNLEIARQQNLGEGFALNLAGKAQIASTGLLSSEQFGLGGSDFGRAFDNSEILGDSGYSLRAELQKNFFYNINYNTTWLTQPYAFIDYGQVYRRYTSVIEPGQSALGSVGLGVRQSLTEGLTLNLELGFPMIEENLINNNNGTRIFFGIEGFF